MDLQTLRRAVENDIDTYRYEVSTNSVGTAWAADRVEAELAAMRAAIVDPYWVDVELHDTHEQIAAHPAVLRKCVVVADATKGRLVAYDPMENEFLLVVRQEGVLLTTGVRGDAVGCFMAR